MKPTRKAISKRTRFDVFKRDSFTCQYCGSHPPAVILHVDHIVAVANGGENDSDNLVTACEPCNLGKGARPLSLVPQSLKDKAAEIEEREEQVRGYNAVLQARRDRLESEMWEVAVLFDKDAEKGFNRDYCGSIQRFIGHLGKGEVIEAADIAINRYPYSLNQSFRYFCGICWRKIREEQ